MEASSVCSWVPAEDPWTQRQESVLHGRTKLARAARVIDCALQTASADACRCTSGAARWPITSTGRGRTSSQLSSTSPRRCGFCSAQRCATAHEVAPPGRACIIPVIELVDTCGGASPCMLHLGHLRITPHATEGLLQPASMPPADGVCGQAEDACHNPPLNYAGGQAVACGRDGPPGRVAQHPAGARRDGALRGRLLPPRPPGAVLCPAHLQQENPKTAGRARQPYSSLSPRIGSNETDGSARPGAGLHSRPLRALWTPGNELRWLSFW